MRLERVQGLLETGALVASVARKCGFSSAETMRRVLLRRLGVGGLAGAFSRVTSVLLTYAL